MTPEKMKQVFGKCAELLDKRYPGLSGLEMDDRQKRQDHAHPQLGFHPKIGIRHLKWMCVAGNAFAANGRLEKAGRWLGFIQGALWMAGFVSIDQMRDWNRPDEVNRAIAHVADVIREGCKQYVGHPNTPETLDKITSVTIEKMQELTNQGIDVTKLAEGAAAMEVWDEESRAPAEALCVIDNCGNERAINSKMCDYHTRLLR